MTLTKGLCECGCGTPTTVAKVNSRKHGYVKGEYLRFVRGHYHRNAGPEYVEDPETGCWVWQRCTGRAGYGYTSVDGVRVSAHRAFYERHVGPIPEGLHIDHLCRNTSCVNPDHLEPVTCAENLRRGQRTRLTKDDVAEIRRLAELGWTQGRIGERFGIWRTHVGRIVNGRAWADA